MVVIGRKCLEAQVEEPELYHLIRVRPLTLLRRSLRAGFPFSKGWREKPTSAHGMDDPCVKVLERLVGAAEGQLIPRNFAAREKPRFNRLLVNS